MRQIPSGPDGNPAEFFKYYGAVALMDIEGDEKNGHIKAGDKIKVTCTPGRLFYIVGHWNTTVVFKTDAKVNIDFEWT